MVRPEHLIPLKAKAWLDLNERSEDGQPVDSRDIRKHKNDVFRLYAIVDPEYQATPPLAIRSDMRQFIDKMRAEDIDLRSMGLGGVSLDSVIDAVFARYVHATP